MTTTRPVLLLVEDDAAIRMACRRFFGKQGFEVLEAETCSAAEGILHDRHAGVAGPV